MIYLTVVALIAAVVVYALCSRLQRRARMSIAVAVFLVPITSMVIWLMMNGDRARAGAITIYPAQTEKDAQRVSGSAK